MAESTRHADALIAKAKKWREASPPQLQPQPVRVETKPVIKPLV